MHQTLYIESIEGWGKFRGHAPERCEDDRTMDAVRWTLSSPSPGPARTSPRVQGDVVTASTALNGSTIVQYENVSRPGS